MWRLLLLSFLSLNILTAQKQITVEKIWKDHMFMHETLPGLNFLKDGQNYTVLIDNKIIEFDLITGTIASEIFNASNYTGNAGFNGIMDGYEFNDDETKILIKSETERIFRRSTKAKFFILDRSSGKLKSINRGDKIMNAKLNPNSEKIAFVIRNNIYFQDLNTDLILQITKDGIPNAIINGAADWVYEEEFSLVQAFQWNSSGDQIAYIKFDETDVKEFILTKHNDDSYPEYVKFKYPKVGEKNSEVSVHFYHLEKGTTNSADLGDLEDTYIPRIIWSKDENYLCVFKLNRHQNHLELFMVDSRSGKSKLMMEEKNKYYISINDDFRFLDDGKHFIWTSEKSGYNHIYLYDLSGSEKYQLTKGDYDVTRFYGVDEKRGVIYYQSARNSPLQRQINRVNLKGEDAVVISPVDGTNSARFSGNFDYFINTHSSINSPPNYILYTSNGKNIKTIRDNKSISLLQSEYGVSEVEFFQFKTSENVDLNGWKIYPPDFDPNKKYPVFMYVYGGPGSQQVVDSWRGYNYWWFQMLAQKGYIIACVDNRGTGARGEEFKKMTYLQLGKYETIDQIEAAKYLGNLPYTDSSRIGIFGWSYGGYMSSLCLFKGNDIFKTAIAVAPVTNWKWYDSVYTERYMRSINENSEGYKENSPVYFADRLKGNYLLIHGFADDNVHFQNTAEMTNALIRENKQFETYFYPNRAHSIRGGHARLHLYTKMTNFILKNL